MSTQQPLISETHARPDRRRCRKCGLFLHYSKFKVRRRKTPHTGMWDLEFDPDCKHCQQFERYEEKNTDRALALVERRAIKRGRILGVSKQWLLNEMHYCDLVPYVRAMMGAEGVCVSCGHRFDGEPDIQFEHREPPRNDHDWAREHARNIMLACGCCNKVKHDKSYTVYLDDEEITRLVNEQHKNQDNLTVQPEPVQQGLFDIKL